MRKEYIMSEEDKVLKRQKIEQNRAKKRPNRDGAKVTKMKKESIDELNFDNDTSVSIASVVSTASTATETYFWESDRKYTDLDANRQSVIDSMSPVPAASVPSPLSPPENLDIAGSKTLEMLKDSYNSPPNYHELSPHVTNHPTKISTDRNSSSDHVTYENSPDVTNLDEKTSAQRVTKQDNGRQNSEIILLECENYKTTSYSPIEENGLITRTRSDENVKKSNYDSCSNCTQISCSIESGISLGTKNSHSKNSNLAMKISQDPELISKMVNNPHLISKIFTNQEVLIKIITDPETLSKLTENPTVSQLLQDNIINVEDKNVEKSEEEIKDNLEVNDNFNSINSHVVEPQNNLIENPILTNLITNNSPDEEKIHIDESSSDDWNKMSDDVTKDVLQEVQRYIILFYCILTLLI